MKQLNQKNLSVINRAIRLPTYDRSNVTPGIVHFGVGNFHRTHQAVYCDKLLCQGQSEWGIIGVSMRSPDIRDALAPQDFLYTEATLGDKPALRVIGSILTILVAPEDPGAVIQAVANNQTQVVTTTITEKGYCLASAGIDVKHPAMRRDMRALDTPQSIYGYLAAAIIKRCQQNGEPLTIMCCDNLHGGGDYLKKGVFKLLERHSVTSKEWAEQQVAFSASMVDRISPSSDDQLKRWVSLQSGVIDARPVSAEAFSQWVIQDSFAGKRPPLSEVGAEFVADISAYEQMKLRLLNAGHSIISVLGYLAGAANIHQALQQPDILDFVTQALRRNVLPVTTVPAGSDGDEYIDAALQRFHNRALPYAVLQVGTDSSQKIQQRWFPTLDDALNQGSNTAYLEFSLAAWVAYIRRAALQGDLKDPHQKKFLQISQNKTPALPSKFLLLAGADNFRFFGDSRLMTSVHHHYRTITDAGIEKALQDFLQDV